MKRGNLYLNEFKLIQHLSLPMSFFVSIDVTAVYCGWRKSESGCCNLKLLWYACFTLDIVFLKVLIRMLQFWATCALCNLCWNARGHSWLLFADLPSVSLGITEPLMKQNGCWQPSETVCQALYLKVCFSWSRRKKITFVILRNRELFICHWSKGLSYTEKRLYYDRSDVLIKFSNLLQ